MSVPLSDWLRLREPADAAARSDTLTRAIVAAMPTDEPTCAVDLATGAGSNIRYLAERLPCHQRWLAVDRSVELLRDLRERTAEWASGRGYDAVIDSGTVRLRGPKLDCLIETVETDLGTLSDRLLFAGRHLVTASALLDLVSESWLRALASHCRAAGAAALFTIIYNGRSVCDPVEPEDALVLDLFNRHQKTDKRLGGRAAGPDAAAVAERCFTDVGYQVRREASDWVLGPGDREMQRTLVDGWAHAATEIDPRHARAIGDWQARRLAHVEAACSRMIVCHDDVAAWPPRVT